MTGIGVKASKAVKEWESLAYISAYPIDDMKNIIPFWAWYNHLEEHIDCIISWHEFHSIVC